MRKQYKPIFSTAANGPEASGNRLWTVHFHQAAGGHIINNAHSVLRENRANTQDFKLNNGRDNIA